MVQKHGVTSGNVWPMSAYPCLYPFKFSGFSDITCVCLIAKFALWRLLYFVHNLIMWWLGQCYASAYIESEVYYDVLHVMENEWGF